MTLPPPFTRESSENVQPEYQLSSRVWRRVSSKSHTSDESWYKGEHFPKIPEYRSVVMSLSRSLKMKTHKSMFNYRWTLEIVQRLAIKRPMWQWEMSHEYYFVENYSQIAHKNRKWNLSKCQGRGMWGGQIFLLIFLGFQAILRRNQKIFKVPSMTKIDRCF